MTELNFPLIVGPLLFLSVMISYLYFMTFVIELFRVKEDLFCYSVIHVVHSQWCMVKASNICAIVKVLDCFMMVSSCVIYAEPSEFQCLLNQALL